MQLKKQMVTLAVVSAMALTVVGSSVQVWAEKGEKEDDKEVKVALTKAQTETVIKVALAAKPGKVEETEGEIQDEKLVCEVEIKTAGDKDYEVTVDVATSKVIKIELDDEDEGDETGEDKD